MLLEERLNYALKDLDAQERIIIYCRFWENMSILEISSFLGISWEKTDQILTSTLEQLRENLNKEPDYYLFEDIA